MTYDLTINFADAESPQVLGTLGQAGVQLVLANVPSPAASLQLFRNGLLQSVADYSLAGQVIVPTPIAAEGDVFVAHYRY